MGITLVTRGGAALAVAAICNSPKEIHMHHVRQSTLGLTAVLTLVCCAVVAPPALADTQPLHLSNPTYQFTSFTCLNASCSLAEVTVDGRATSNLAAGLGTYHADLQVDFSPGGACNIVTETSSFTFDKGKLVVTSHHADCATNGLRINTSFTVGGKDSTGAFRGATGRGQQFSATTPPFNSNAKEPVIWNGTISF